MTEPRKSTSYGDKKDVLLKRLNRAEGQLRGISRMIAEDTYCIDVLTQISAAQAALDKTALELLRGHAKHCLTLNSPADIRPITTAASDQQADEFITAVKRLIAR